MENAEGALCESLFDTTQEENLGSHPSSSSNQSNSTIGSFSKGVLTPANLLQKLDSILSSGKSSDEIVKALRSEKDAIFTTPKVRPKRKKAGNDDSLSWKKEESRPPYTIVTEADYDSLVFHDAERHYRKVYDSLKKILLNETFELDLSQIDDDTVMTVLAEHLLSESVRVLHKYWVSKWRREQQRGCALSLEEFKAMVGLNFVLKTFRSGMGYAFKFLDSVLRKDAPDAVGLASISNYRRWKRYLMPFHLDNDNAAREACDRLRITSTLQV